MDLRELTEFLKDTAGYIITIAIILFVFTFIVALQPVAGNSMSPTLEDTEVTIVSRFTYRISKIKRNEIVVLKHDKKSYVKRVVALPGEKVEYLNGMLYINDVAYKETFLDSDVITYNFLFEDICSKEECPDGVIPENKYFLLGDNRTNSTDSRDKTFGLIDKSEIKGKIIYKVWPLSELGKVN